VGEKIVSEQSTVHLLTHLFSVHHSLSSSVDALVSYCVFTSCIFIPFFWM